MRLLLVIGLCGLSASPVFSQRVVDVNTTQNVSGYYFSVSGQPFVNVKFVNLVEGSPYFKDNWQNASLITEKGYVHKNVPVKIDLFDHTIHYLDSQGKEFIATDPLKEVLINTTSGNDQLRFVNAKAFPLLDAGWYLTLLDAKVLLFKEYKKLLSEDKPYGSATYEQKIDTKEKYIIIHNNQVFRVGSVKEVPAIFPDKKEALQAFIKEQKKSSQDSKMVELISYYTTLTN